MNQELPQYNLGMLHLSKPVNVKKIIYRISIFSWWFLTYRISVVNKPDNLKIDRNRRFLFRC
jgi:hypothetical protein